MKKINIDQKKLTRVEIRRFVTFGIVGAIGTVINTAILYALTTFAGLYYLIASAIAIEVAIISNFVGNYYITFKGSNKTPWTKKFISFQLVSMLTIAASLLILWLLTNRFGLHYLIVLNLVTIFIVFTANFILNRKFTWTHRETDALETG